MNATATPVGETTAKPPSQQAAHDLLQFWLKECDGFLRWQRREIIERAPSREEIAEHRDGLKWMLRFTRMVHAQVADPDFPLRGFAAEVAGRLLQLEESWGLIHEAMPDAEADAILRAAFPDESRTGSAA